MFTIEEAKYIADYVAEMLECLDELMAEPKDDFNDGQILAYLHVLRTIQGNIFNDDVKKYLWLDIDLDKKYLNHPRKKKLQ